MSRIGKLPIPLNSKVKVEYKEGLLKVKGPLGEMSYQTPANVNLRMAETSIEVESNYDLKEGRMNGGTARAIIANMVQGVSDGFSKTLELVGVGYRAAVSGQVLNLNLGYSHPIDYQLPSNVKASVERNTSITLTSCDKQVLGQVCAEIRKYRPPEPYKGKGILFAGEKIRRKAGKTAKK